MMGQVSTGMGGQIIQVRSQPPVNSACGTVKEVSAFRLSNSNKCSKVGVNGSSLQADSQPKSVVLV